MRTDDKECDAERCACHRSWTLRTSYLCLDRYVLHFAVKELARRMQQPNVKNMQAPKRLVRFLKGSPRCLVVHGRQPEQQVLDVFSDNDWLGCAKSRRSTWNGKCETPPYQVLWVQETVALQELAIAKVLECETPAD